MASSLLLKKFFSFGVSRHLPDNMKPFRVHLELNFQSLVGVCRSLRQFSSSSGSSKFDFTDLTCPHTWYPNARKKKRNVVLHVGPTNSGKTHHALKQLESSSSGIYCGPLRLLAWEVAKRLNKAKVPCDLITGQEREEIDGAKHKAVTVEMADVTVDYHCAVIDEIQAFQHQTDEIMEKKPTWNRLIEVRESLTGAEVTQQPKGNHSTLLVEESLYSKVQTAKIGMAIAEENPEFLSSFHFQNIKKIIFPSHVIVDVCYLCLVFQMVGCRTRGFSFTRALLGISVDELHLCGDAAAVPLIQEILEVTGDAVKVQYYERLSPLIPSKVPLGSFSNIQTGDCIVTFSRHEIYRLKKKIEYEEKHLCSVVYGSLPPETRTRQATMFNDESSEFDVLVASDAIGMGLNLNISRIVFSTLKKFDGISTRELSVPEIKQIAGRAGRYGSKYPCGEVTCINAEDLPLLHSSLESPSPVLEEHFLENAKLSANYFIANCEEMLKVASVIDELPLGLHDKYLFCISPVDMNDDISSQGLTQFAQNYSKRGIVRLREIFTPGTLQVPKTQTALKELESIHKVLDLYVWLSFRLEDSFPDRELASSQKAICSLLIEEFLERLGWQKPRARSLPPRTSLSSLFSKDIRQHL
ncbi:hypothetical protein HHK36_012675 [Tetracentron sinense]|uniref:Helicase C-terminal domain-containing protein n=1 Tax=Tetracentron sinense TaxID=13715 RepID=A0A834Z680_TETSI|nr:hypothetical protein HHK36_012675 [Tetracentron sinense]